MRAEITYYVDNDHNIVLMLYPWIHDAEAASSLLQFSPHEYGSKEWANEFAFWHEDLHLKSLRTFSGFTLSPFVAEEALQDNMFTPMSPFTLNGT